MHAADDQVNMVGLFESFAEMDGDGLARHVLKFSGGAQRRTAPLLPLQQQRSAPTIAMQQRRCPPPPAAPCPAGALLPCPPPPHPPTPPPPHHHPPTHPPAACCLPLSLVGVGEEQSCPNPESFAADVAEYCQQLEAESAAVPGTTHGAEALAHVLELVRQHDVNMPGHICATVVTTMVLEGWSNQLDPNHSTLQGEQLTCPALPNAATCQLIFAARALSHAGDAHHFFVPPHHLQRSSAWWPCARVAGWGS